MITKHSIERAAGLLNILLSSLFAIGAIGSLFGAVNSYGERGREPEDFFGLLTIAVLLVLATALTYWTGRSLLRRKPAGTPVCVVRWLYILAGLPLLMLVLAAAIEYPGWQSILFALGVVAAVVLTAYSLAALGRREM